MQSALDDAILKVLKDYAAAIYTKDLKAVAALFDDNVCVFDMWDIWSYQGIAAWRAMVREWFEGLGSERVVVDMENVSTLSTPHLAWASAYVKYTAVSAAGERLRSLENRLSWVLKPQDGTWKIIHEHSSCPIDHATMKAIMRP